MKLRHRVFLAGLVCLVIVLAAVDRTALRTRLYFTYPGRFPDSWALSGVPIWWTVQPGVKMLLDPRDMGPRMILDGQVYEAASMAMIREHLPPNGTFVDIGANFGIYSLMMAAWVARGIPPGRVVAVEPNPEALELLRGNIAASHANVEVMPVACGADEAEMMLFVAPRFNTGETSLAKQNAGWDGPVRKAVKVSVRKLDSLLQNARVDAIKIDVEGAEYLVLQGARETLARAHPMVLVEIIDRQLVTMGSSAEAVRGLLRGAGYREGRHDGDNVEFLWAGR